MSKLSTILKRCSRHIVTTAMFVLSLWICSGIVLAQGLTGQLSGSVTDSSGAVVANASLQLTNIQTGQVRSTTTSAEGRFVFPEILPGNFNLTIEANGFKKLEQTNIVVSAAERVTLPGLVLQVGQVGETVTVTAEQSAIKTESAERSGVINTRQYQELPLKGRDWMSGTRLLPGVVDSNATGRDAPGWSTAGGISINGTRTTAVYLNLDGVNLSDTGQNGTNYLAPNIDAIAEVKVLTNNFQAEYGHSSGGNITTVTKSGTRDFHGGAYYFNRNEWFNANEWANNRNPAVAGSTTAVAVPKPKYRFNNPGYFVGGPVLIPGTDFNKNRDKLVFFFSQEFLPRKIGSTVQTVVPTLLERAGDFSQAPLNGAGFAALVNPLTRVAIPNNNLAAAGLIDARGLALLKLLPEPNIPATTVCSVGKCNRQDDIIDTRPRRDTILRVDFNATSKDQTYVRLIQDFEARKGGTFLGSTVTLPQFKTVYTVRSVGAVGTWIRTINSNMLNELTVGINRAAQSVDPFENALDLNNRAKTGLGSLPAFYPTSNPLNLIPNVTFGVTSATNLAVEGRFPFFGTNSVWDTSDNFSYNRGNHHMKFGIFWEHTARNAARSTVFNGAYNFSPDANNPLNNGYGYANALLGTVASYTEASGHPDGHARYNQFEWYAQDTWKINSRLTVDAGARFIIVQGSYSAGDKLAAFDPAVYDASKQPKLVAPYLCTAADVLIVANQGVCGTAAGRRIAKDPGTGLLLPAVKIGTFSSVGTPFQGMTIYDQKLLKLPPIQIGPRLGIAWDVFGNGKTAVRAGAGMYYDRFADDHVLQSRELPPLVIAPVANYTTINNLAATPLSLSPVNVQYLNRSFRPPAVYNWSLGIQQNLGFGTMIDIAYVGNQQRHLLVSRNLNAVPYGANFLASGRDVTTFTTANPTGNALPANFLRPLQGYGDIIYKDFAANGNYNALQVQVNKRFSKNMTFNVSYTWSKALDVTDAEGSGPTNPYINPRSRNYGPAGFDRRQILVLNYTYNLPNFSKNFGGNMLSKIALDGWEFSGVSNFQTGPPVGIACNPPGGTDLTGAAGGGIDTRCVQVSNPKDLSGLSSDYWFNPNAFKVPFASGAGITNCGAGCVNGVGTVSKAPIYGPGLNNWDIALFKNFQLWSEATRLQFRIEGFNIMNHTQYQNGGGSAVGNVGSFSAANVNLTANFGQFSAAAPSRRFQVGLKFYF